MKILDLNSRQDLDGLYVRRYEFTSDEEDVFILALIQYSKSSLFNSIEKTTLSYMIDTFETHLSLGNEE